MESGSYHWDVFYIHLNYHMRQKIKAGARHIVRHSTQPAKRVHFYVLIFAMIILWAIYGRNGATQTNANIAIVPQSWPRRIIGQPIQSTDIISIPTDRKITTIVYEGPMPSKANTVPRDANGNMIPAIAMRFGKVNQHFDPATGKWATDPDGIAWWDNYDPSNPASENQWNNRKVEYCKRFFPKTASVKSIWNVTIHDWKSRGNEWRASNTVEWWHCSETPSNTNTGSNNTGSNNTGNNNTGGRIPFPEFSWTWSISLSFNGDKADNILIPSVSKVLWTIVITAQDQDMMLKSLLLKIESSWSSAFKAIAGSVLSNISIVYERWPYDKIAELEDKRMSSAAGLNDIVVFGDINFPILKQWQSMELKIVAKVNTIDTKFYNNTNFINLKLATSYNHPTLLSESNWVVVFGISAGGYLRTTWIPANLQVSNNHLVAWNHPFFIKNSEGTATEIFNGAIMNPGNYPLAIRSIDYNATSQVAGDIRKGFTLFFWPGNPPVKGQLIAGRTTRITFPTPIVIGVWQWYMLRIVLDQPFVNTASNPTAGQRIFKIENISYAQQFPGIVDKFISHSPYYLKSLWLPLSVAY